MFIQVKFRQNEKSDIKFLILTGSKFKLKWNKLDESSPIRPLISSSDTCRQDVFVNSSTTYITSGNYPRNYENNLDCDWIIRSDPMTKIQIKVVFINIESNSRCLYDALTIYDGLEGNNLSANFGNFVASLFFKGMAKWNRSMKLCQRGHRGRIFTSSGNLLKINFKTDHSISGRGFRISLKTVCGGYATAKQGVISSPNYPENYPNNLDCTWAIKTKPGRTFTFWFENLNVTSNDLNICDGDYLMLRNGDQSTDPLMLIHPGGH